LERDHWLRAIDCVCYIVFTTGILLWTYSFVVGFFPVDGAPIREDVWQVIEPYASHGVWFALGAAIVGRAVSILAGRSVFVSRR
jgi:hypothetical protein